MLSQPCPGQTGSEPSLLPQALGGDTRAAGLSDYHQGRFHPNPSAIKVARLHYSGGGDWYWGNSAVPNFLEFVRDNTDMPVDTIERQTRITDPDLFEYPFLFATGHGVIRFTPEEKERLRQYLLGGGFLFVNDSYGMAETFHKEMAALFPEREAVELPFDHPIYRCFYDFPNGPPKIHEHDKKPPRGYAIIINGRVVLYFLVESDIGDGWEDAQVHNDPPDKRREAFRMGLNILTYALLY
jgi:glycine/D-amino acid oxidase-like deaminating enzyme